MHRQTAFRAGTVVTALVLMVGCEPNGTVTPTVPGDQAFWGLSSGGSDAIVLGLSPLYDTLQLNVRAVNPDGVPLEHAPAITFLSTNVNTVEVSPTGLLHAVAPTASTLIVASVTMEGLTHTDTIVVAVTEDPGTATIASLSLQPQPGDSARFALGGSLLEPFRTLSPTIIDQDGLQQVGLPVHFTSLDLTHSHIDPRGGTLTPVSLGHVKFVGEMMAYHQHFTDTVDYRIDLPLYVKVNVYGPFYANVAYVPGSMVADSVTLGIGGVVEWENTGMLPGTLIQITFDSSQLAAIDSVPEQSTCQSYGIECDTRGNIAPFGPPAANDPDFDKYFRDLDRARRFTVPGVYPVQDIGWNTHMKVVVVDEAAP